MIRPLFEIGISRYVPVILLATLTLGACTAEDPASPEVPRPVKVETVVTQPQQDPQLLGTVRTQHRVDLSFEVGGVLDQLLVRPGQDVQKGAVLAQLDRQPAQLRLTQAKAKLQAQKALVVQNQQLFERSQRLLADGSLAKKDVEQAQSQYQSAVAERDIDDASSKLAQREYTLTQLTAPFDGRVVSYTVEPHTQIAAAQTVVQLVASGHQDVVVQVPVDQARGLLIGSEAVGVDEARPGTPLKFKLRSLSPEAKAGLLQEAKFELISPNVQLIDGTTLLLQLAPSKHTAAITLPPQAFKGTPTAQGAEVFIYEPQFRRVMRREVQLAGLQGSRLVVRAGLLPGEQVVTAGAAFLTDRQEVTLFKSSNSSGTE